MRQQRNGRIFKQRTDRRFDAKLATHAGRDLRSQKRVPAQFKEIVIAADLLNAQHVAPDRGESIFQLILRRAEFVGNIRAREFRHWQREPVEFSVRGKRQRLKRNEK